VNPCQNGITCTAQLIRRPSESAAVAGTGPDRLGRIRGANVTARAAGTAFHQGASTSCVSGPTSPIPARGCPTHTKAGSHVARDRAAGRTTVVGAPIAARTGASAQMIADAARTGLRRSARGVAGSAAIRVTGLAARGAGAAVDAGASVTIRAGFAPARPPAVLRPPRSASRRKAGRVRSAPDRPPAGVRCPGCPPATNCA